jgi:predicted HicB family RNase H-like nuclease
LVHDALYQLMRENYPDLNIHREAADRILQKICKEDGETSIGRVQDVDDIISFHGDSVAEFDSNFHSTIEDYLAASKALGSAPEKPASGSQGTRTCGLAQRSLTNCNSPSSNTSTEQAFMPFNSLYLFF